MKHGPPPLLTKSTTCGHNWLGHTPVAHGRCNFGKALEDQINISSQTARGKIRGALGGSTNRYSWNTVKTTNSHHHHQQQHHHHPPPATGTTATITTHGAPCLTCQPPGARPRGANAAAVLVFRPIAVVIVVLVDGDTSADVTTPPHPRPVFSSSRQSRVG